MLFFWYGSPNVIQFEETLPVSRKFGLTYSFYNPLLSCSWKTTGNMAKRCWAIGNSFTSALWQLAQWVPHPVFKKGYFFLTTFSRLEGRLRWHFLPHGLRSCLQRNIHHEHPRKIHLDFNENWFQVGHAKKAIWSFSLQAVVASVLPDIFRIISSRKKYGGTYENGGKR